MLSEPAAELPAVAALEREVEDARQRFVDANPASRARHERAAAVMPGGNTRTSLFYAPFPLAMTGGQGCRIRDADGHEYIDFLGDYTAALFGHSDARIRAAIVEALNRGLNLSATNAYEVELAELLSARFRSMRQLRLTNSGTEANLMAITAAVNFTGRKKLMVFSGCYHGAALGFPNGAAPTNVPYDFIVSPYNDAERARALIEEHAATLAAVLVEPMLGAGGCIAGRGEFLHELRAATRAAGALLIFDEVMTSRLAAGGRQETLNIEPDLTTLGKYIGGGMSCGAFGGRADIMAQFDSRRAGALAHSGTFNNNVLTMAAGITALRDVFPPEAAAALNAAGDALREALNRLCAEAAVRMQFTGLGSLMNVHGCATPIRSPADLGPSSALIKDLYFYRMLEEGFFIARRGFITLMLPTGELERRAFTQATGRFIDRYRHLLHA